MGRGEGPAGFISEGGTSGSGTTRVFVSPLTFVSVRGKNGGVQIRGGLTSVVNQAPAGAQTSSPHALIRNNPFILGSSYQKHFTSIN